LPVATAPKHIFYGLIHALLIKLQILRGNFHRKLSAYKNYKRTPSRRLAVEYIIIYTVCSYTVAV